MNQRVRSIFWAIAVSGSFVCLHFLFSMLVQQALRYVDPNPRQSTQIFFDTLTLACAAFLVWRFANMDTHDALPVSSAAATRLGSASLALIIGSSLQFPLAEISNLLASFIPYDYAEIFSRQEMLRWGSGVELLKLVIAIGVIVPLSEELIFRRLLLGTLLKHWPPSAAIALSALCFGVAHLDRFAVGYAFAAGCVIGWVFFRTQSLTLAILVHAGVNFVPLFVQDDVVMIRGFNHITDQPSHLPVPLLIASTIICGLSIYAMHLLFPTKRHE